MIRSLAIASLNYKFLSDSDERLNAIADCLSHTLRSNFTNAARVYIDIGCAANHACSSLEYLEIV
ncbi:hypothetical protein, partial [Francisella tularensis]|uniref:hypothetical protein n=1 Tax=Francisella tularensis TaxID=263 RepID=UPI00174A8A2D